MIHLSPHELLDRHPSRPPADWDELVQVHDDRDIVQPAPDELPVTDIHTL